MNEIIHRKASWGAGHISQSAAVVKAIPHPLVILPREKREAASNYARRVLEYNILHLNLEPGAQLFEKELAEQIGVSRTPVREALLELRRRNIIDIYPQHGTFVSYLSKSRSDDTRFMRYALEGALVLEAATKRDDAALERMYENVHLQKLYWSRDADRFLALDAAFHGEIYAICGHERLYNTVIEQSLHFDRLRLLSYNIEASKELIAEHEGMTNAIERGDGEAAQAICHKHLTRAIGDYDVLRTRYPQYFAPGT